MEDQRLSDLTELAEAPASGDLFFMVDVSDDTDHVSGSSKKITAENLFSDLTTQTIHLTAAPAADHTATGLIVEYTAGENLVFGDACYFKSDGKMWKGDADAIATSSVIGLALETISANAAGDFLLLGIARDDSWNWTVGRLVYLSTTAGALTQTAPSGTDDVIQILGVATHADRMYFNPTLVQVEHTG